MKYIKKFNESITFSKVLIIHGFGGKPRLDWIKQLEDNNIKAVSPEIDYKSPILIKEIEHYFESNKFDFVIGHSAGGLIAIHLANKYNVKCLVFNPAIGEKWFKYLNSDSLDDSGVETPKEFTKNCCKGFVDAVVGLDDESISPKKQIEFLEFVGANIQKVEKVKHDIPEWLFSVSFNKLLKK